MSTFVHKKVAGSLLTLTMLASIAYPLTLPKKVEAAGEVAKAVGLVAALAVVSAIGLGPGSGKLSVPTGSATQDTKEAWWDPVVNLLIASVISTIIQSTTNWVNSGFQGKPSFIQDFGQASKDIGDQVFTGVLKEIELSDARTKGLSTFICGPFSQEIHDAFRIRIAAAKGGSFTQHSACTIEGVLAEAGQTLEAFEDDFTQGGWPAWLELTTNPVNNRYGAYFIINNEVGKRIAEAVDDQNKQLVFGSGFLSQKVQGECLDTPEETAAYNAAGVLQSLDQNSSQQGPDAMLADRSVANPDPVVCGRRAPDRIVTPGQVISTQFSRILGSGNDKLVNADEIDELVSALLNQALTQALTGVRGLFGASEAEPGETSLTDQLGEEADRLGEEADKQKEAAEAAGKKAIEDAAAAKAKAAETEAKAKEYAKCVEDLEKAKEDGYVLVPRDDGSFEVVYAYQGAIASLQKKCDKLKEELDLLIDEAGEAGETEGAYCPFGFGTGFTDEENRPGEKVEIYDPGFTSTEGKPSLRINLPAKVKGKSYDHITVDLDVTMGPWNQNCAASFGGRCYHPIFWSLRDNDRWCFDQMADVVLVGPGKQLLKLTSKIGGDQKDDAGGSFSGKFHVRYEFNGNGYNGGTAGVTLSGNNVAKSASFKTVGFINFGSGAFFEFGAETNPGGPEVAPIGWKFQNIRIILEDS